MYRGIGTPLSLTKHAFFLLCMYGASKYHQNIQGASKHMGVSKHTGGIQTYVGGVQTYGDIQTYAGHPNISEFPNIQGAFLHAFLSHKVGFATSSE